MTRGSILASLGGLLLLAAIAAGASTLPLSVTNTLTVIDTVPTKTQLDGVFGAGALDRLSTIAHDRAEDPGIRLRAIHALAKYCPDPCSTEQVAHTTLTQLIDENRGQTSGEGVVLLRATIETLGLLGVASDVTVLVSLLDHPSRDIRAATARSLRDLCNAQAIAPLRVRYTVEPIEQVKRAISDALRILGQCSQVP